MEDLSLHSQITLYVLLAQIGLLALIIWGWQIQVLRGKEMQNAAFTFHQKQSVQADFPARAAPIVDEAFRREILTVILKRWKRDGELDVWLKTPSHQGYLYKWFAGREISIN